MGTASGRPWPWLTLTPRRARGAWRGCVFSAVGCEPWRCGVGEEHVPRLNAGITLGLPALPHPLKHRCSSQK